MLQRLIEKLRASLKDAYKEKTGNSELPPSHMTKELLFNGPGIRISMSMERSIDGANAPFRVPLELDDFDVRRIIEGLERLIRVEDNLEGLITRQREALKILRDANLGSPEQRRRECLKFLGWIKDQGKGTFKHNPDLLHIEYRLMTENFCIDRWEAICTLADEHGFEDPDSLAKYLRRHGFKNIPSGHK